MTRAQAALVGGMLGIVIGVALTLLLGGGSAMGPGGLDGLTLISTPDQRGRRPLGDQGPASVTSAANTTSAPATPKSSTAPDPVGLCPQCRARRAGDEADPSAGREPEAGPETAIESVGPGDVPALTFAQAEDSTAEGPLKDGFGRLLVRVTGLPSGRSVDFEARAPEAGEDEDGRSFSSPEGALTPIDLPAGDWVISAADFSEQRKGSVRVTVVEGETREQTIALKLTAGLHVIVRNSLADERELGFDPDDLSLELRLIEDRPGLLTLAGHATFDLDGISGYPDLSYALEAGAAPGFSREGASFTSGKPGRYRLIVGYETGPIMVMKRVQLSGEGKELKLTLPGLTAADVIQVQVLDESGGPLKEASVDLESGAGVLTGVAATVSELGEGRYVLLPSALTAHARTLEAPRVLVVQHDDKGTFRQPIGPDVRSLTFRCPGSVFAEVAARGLPDGVTVNVSLTQPETWGGESAALVAGRARIGPLAPGRYELSLLIRSAYESQTILFDQVVELESTRTLSVQVPPLGSLEVHAGLPDGGLLELSQPGGDSLVRSPVMNGRARFDHLVAGEWELRKAGSLDGFAMTVSIPASGPVTFDPNGRRGLRVELRGAGYLTEVGLRNGDEIIAVDGTPIADRPTGSPLPTTGTVRLTVARGSTTLTLPADAARLTSLQAHLGGRLRGG